MKKRIISINVSLASLLLVFLMFSTDAEGKGFNIMLDPGHGGSDSGAVNYNTVPTTYEKVINLQLATKVKKYLDPYAENVYMTRTSDRYVSLEDRAVMGNSKNVDLFLSIHHDSSYSSVVNGISTHYSSYRPGLDKLGNTAVYNGRFYPYVDERKVGSSTHIFYKDNGVTKSANINDVHVFDSTPTSQAVQSSELALKIADNLGSLGFDRMYSGTGVKDNIFYVVRWTNMPSVLVEAGFLSNPVEVAKLRDPASQEKSAKKIADAVIDYFQLRKLDITKVDISSSNDFEVNSPITFNTQTGESNNPQFKYWMKRDGKWETLQDYSSNSKFTWTPKKAGKYEFVVHAKNGSSTSNYDDYYPFEVTVKEKPVDLTVKEGDMSLKDYRLSVTSSNSENKLYKYWVQHNGKWELISNYSEVTRIDWIPPTGGEYKFVVHMKDKNSSNSYDDYDTETVKVVQNPINLTISNSIKEGIPTTLQASIASSDNYLFKYWAYDGTTWYKLSDFTKEEVKWTPTLSGDVNIIVHAKKENSTNAYDYYSKQSVNIAHSNISTQADSQNIKAYDIVELSTSVSNSSGMLYKYWMKKGDEWVRVQNYSSDSTYQWQPTETGTYEFLVHVKNENSSNNYDDYRLVSFNVEDRSLTLNITPEKKKVMGLPITIEVEGGFEGAEYKYHVDQNNVNTLNKTDSSGTDSYISTNKWSWTPDATGSAKVTVLVKGPDSSDYDYKIEKTLTIEEPDNVSVGNISLNDDKYPIEISAEASGGTIVQYKFWSYNLKTKEWVKLQDYSTNKNVTWMPDQLGDYQIVVHVKDQYSSNSYDAYKVLNYKSVRLPAASMNSLRTTPDGEGSIGKTVSIIAEATADTSALYKFWLKDLETGQWTRLQDYTENNIIAWNPTTPGEYEIVVHVKDEKSNRTYDDYKVLHYNIKDSKIIQVDKLATSPVSKALIGQDVTISATGTGSESLLYKFWVYDKKRKTTMKLNEYQQSNSIIWHPTDAGTYQLIIHIKDAQSTNAYDAYRTLDYTIE